MKPNRKALLFAGLAVFFWSTVATAFKIALRELDVLQLIFYASGVAVVLLFLILLYQRKTGLLLKQTRRDWLFSAALGVFNPLLYYFILLKAYSLLPAQLAQPLNMIWPIVLALLSVPLLGQKIGWISIAALLVSFTGVVFISSQGGTNGFQNTNMTGVALAVGSSVMWALYWILNVRDRRDEIVKLFLNFSFGFLFLTVAVFFFSGFRVPLSTGFYAAIYVGVFEAGITYVLWMKAMQLSASSAKIGNLVFLAPFLSLVFIRFILKETLYITTFIGLIFIIAGILIQQIDKKNH
jgi:drug/metabolite transporter (DMT)-like permease